MVHALIDLSRSQELFDVVKIGLLMSAESEQIAFWNRFSNGKCVHNLEIHRHLSPDHSG